MIVARFSCTFNQSSRDSKIVPLIKRIIPFMIIYEVTYLVENLHVTGYLGLPDGIQLKETDVQETVQQATGTHSYLPIHAVGVHGDTTSDTDTSNGIETSGESMDTNPVTTNTKPETKFSEDSVCEDLSLGGGRNISQDSVLDRSEAFPAILYCRGGIGRVGMSRLEWISTFCRLGFVVFSPWYRGTLGTDGRDEFGGADVADCVMGFQILRQLACVRANDITLLGFSRGSINATLTAIAEPTANGLILWGGVSDLAATYEERVDLRRMLRRVVGHTPRRLPEEYAARSPIRYADKIPCRTLVVHSTRDPQVAFHHGTDMYSALLEAGVPVTWHGYEGYAHHFDPLIRQAVIERMLSWATRT